MSNGSVNSEVKNHALERFSLLPKNRSAPTPINVSATPANSIGSPEVDIAELYPAAISQLPCTYWVNASKFGRNSQHTVAATLNGTSTANAVSIQSFFR